MKYNTKWQKKGMAVNKLCVACGDPKAMHKKNGVECSVKGCPCPGEEAACPLVVMPEPKVAVEG